MIITGGENVSSREVEDVLSTHPPSTRWPVVGVPDDYWGRRLRRRGAAADSADPGELADRANPGSPLKRRATSCSSTPCHDDQQQGRQGLVRRLARHHLDALP